MEFTLGVSTLAGGAQEWQCTDPDLVTDKHYEHDQASASTSWVCEHNLGKFPSVTIVTSAGDEVEGDVSHDSVNQATLTFSAAFSGKAYFN